MNYFEPDFTAVVLNVALCILAIIAAVVFAVISVNEFRLYQVRVQAQSKPLIDLWHNQEAPLSTSAAQYLALLD